MKAYRTIFPVTTSRRFIKFAGYKFRIAGVKGNKFVVEPPENPDALQRYKLLKEI